MGDAFVQVKNSEFEMPGKGDLILANDRYYSTDCYETMRNNNVLIVGASGTGKTRSIITPNILQAEGSYIVSDPKGNLHKLYGKYLENKGYIVKKIDFVHPEESDEYNFFDYIRSDSDLVKIARTIIYSAGICQRDPFWDEAATLYLSAIMGYLYEFRPRYEQNINSLGKLAVASDVSENPGNIDNVMDRIMNEVARRNPKSFCLKQYRKFKVAADRTIKSILITVNAKLATMDTPEVEKMMGGGVSEVAKDGDNILSDKKVERFRFEDIGTHKTAVFVEVSDRDRSLDPLADIFFSQAMDELCKYADDRCDDYRLPVPVRFLMDDFATNVSISDFPRMISSIRSRGISVMLSIQSEAQLFDRYGDDGRTVISNCDSYIYMGGNDVETAHNVARRADLPENRVLNMPVGMNILFRRGENPAISYNFNLEQFLDKIREGEKNYDSCIC